MRNLFVLMHRWAGLAIAGFLIVSGVTGAIISWDHELDDLLNPHLMHVPSRGQTIPALDLAQRIESRYPQVSVTFLPVSAGPGESMAFGVSPRVNPQTGKLYEPGFNQVFMDPVSGTELGKRYWGAPWPLTSENLVSFLYVLHFSLHIPEMWGSDRWGIWLLGIVAIIWTLDSFIGFYLTLPARRRNNGGRQQVPVLVQADDELAAANGRSWWQRWQPAWRLRWAGGSYRLNFDLHRASALWTWGLLLVLAFTAFSLNLYREVFFPAMSMVSQVTPGPFDTRTPRPLHDPYTPQVGYAEVIARARADAAERGWSEPVGNVFYTPDFNVYGVQFFYPGDDHGAAGVGPARLYYDGEDGRYIGDRQPWQGTAADVFVQMQFPLHSGRILGLPGRILISLMGLVVAVLSVTGLIIWWRKRLARITG